MNAPESVLREVVERLDGIVGWILRLWMRFSNRLKKVVKEELENLEKMSRRYTKTLKVISLGGSTWRGLEKMDFIERKFDENRRPRYEIVDPIVKRTVRDL